MAEQKAHYTDTEVWNRLRWIPEYRNVLILLFERQIKPVEAAKAIAQLWCGITPSLPGPPKPECSICGHPQHDTVCNRAMWSNSCDCPGETWAAAWAETVRPNAEAAKEQDRLRQEERICSCGAAIVHVKDEFWRRKENGEVSTGGHYHAPAKAER